ncbi:MULTISPECIES: hypothetical protein [Streptomyces]|uniref:hypothetical protein n=1 Tax=Streptomyces TaxID=1883 RepID=UPI00163BEE99|nr:MULTISPECIES: hypothetical protein [Streptomyces]MBC2878426.1 hypothetical protein [Streptomyces sp. TYQ1024]UBI38762.1 hypothetical protein K7I03_21425 [Streptomyces mobaraensis]UKW31343.1 hypothetical protein MCU78_21375 [Streptomyces sp. TYQ1024]
MPEAALPPPPPPASRRPAPCVECRRIREAYYAASRQGDRVAAQGWIVAMGRHHRWVH